MAKDLLVECGNPATFDRTIQQMGAVLVGGPDNFIQHDGYYVMRVLEDSKVGYLKFAITNQGYGKIIKELESLI